MSPSILSLRGLRAPIDDKLWQSDSRLRVGRVGIFEVVLDDSSVSRQHAEFVLTPQGWCVHDLESTNGTYLNGLRVGRAQMKVRESDIVQFGELAVVVESIKEQGTASLDWAEPAEILHKACHSWEEMPALMSQVAASGRAELISALVQVGRDFHNHNNLRTYLRTALWDIAAVLDCRLAAISTLDEFSDRLRLQAVFNMGATSTHDSFVVPEIAEQICRQNESIICRRDDFHFGMQAEMYVVIRSPRKVLGVLQAIRGLDQQPFTEDDLIFAEVLCSSISNSIESLDNLLRKEQEVVVSTLTTLTQLTHLRDDWAGGRTKRATDYALIVGERLRVSESERHCLQIGTALRDLGRLGLPDHILNKPGPLTQEEIRLVKSHVSKGVSLLESVTPLVPIIPIMRSHHERWDGKGYPDGLSGEQIPLIARIVAVADAFDALTTDRPYRPACSLDQAFQEITAQSGSQFDPRCVEALLGCRREIGGLFVERDRLCDTVVSERIAPRHGKIG